VTQKPRPAAETSSETPAETRDSALAPCAGPANVECPEPDADNQQRRRMKRAPREREQRFRATVELAPVGIAHVGVDGHWLWVNQRLCDIVGYSRDELLAHTFEDITYAGDVELDLSFTQRMLAGELETYGMEKRYVRRDGTLIWVQLTVSLVRDAAGRPNYFISIVQDISDRKHVEEEREQILSMVSHELKTPLTSLKARAHLLQRSLTTIVGVRQVPHVAEMELAIGRIERMLNDLLDLTRMERGTLELHLQRCDLVALCREAADEQMAASGRMVTFDLPDEQVMVEADGGRIAQVLANLLTNATKYSPEDRAVVVALHLEDGEARVSVRDEGPGIPPESLPRLFDRFYRVPGIAVQSGSSVGLGLGLYISKTLIEEHGGRMDVESEQGAGTTFTFMLPVA
jgi:PAS domain S-box-containing protein